MNTTIKITAAYVIITAILLIIYSTFVSDSPVAYSVTIIITGVFVLVLIFGLMSAKDQEVERQRIHERTMLDLENRKLDLKQYLARAEAEKLGIELQRDKWEHEEKIKKIDS